MKSAITKRSRFARNLFWLLSFLCNFGPIVAFFIYGLVLGSPSTHYTVALVGIVGIVLGIISLISKFHWRTPLIIIIGGLYFAITQFAVVLITISICIVLDELIFTPLYHHYKSKTQINKEIDRRM